MALKRTLQQFPPKQRQLGECHLGIPGVTRGYRKAALVTGVRKHNAMEQEVGEKVGVPSPLLLTDVAIRRFRLRHSGAPPTTLRELLPEFLDRASGRDPFSGVDLMYRANPDGTYLLYSVGTDGVDNGGDPSVVQGQNFFWDSRDMVWPCSR